MGSINIFFELANDKIIPLLKSSPVKISSYLITLFFFLKTFNLKITLTKFNQTVDLLNQKLVIEKQNKEKIKEGLDLLLYIASNKDIYKIHSLIRVQIIQYLIEHIFQ